MAVLNTASPKVSPRAPRAQPTTVVPSSRARSAEDGRAIALRPSARTWLGPLDAAQRRHFTASPSRTVTPPRSTVWTTRPRSVLPVKAEFLLFEANGGATTHSAEGSKTTRFAGRPAPTGPP